MLVIADRDRAQAVAGVMGGAASEVSAATTTVAFESAYFKPASVRRTSKRLGLKTEASSRFERGADIGAQVVALQRALALMEQIGAGRPVGRDRRLLPAAARSRSGLHLRRERLALLLGVPVPDAEVVRILRRLGLDVTPAGDGWDVVAPTFRVDLLREADLIEEVGRHYGFDKLEATFPVMTAAGAAAGSARPARSAGAAGADRRRLLRGGHIRLHRSEGGGAVLRRDGATRRGLVSRVANPLSAKFDTLRPSLLPGLVDAVAHNRRHGRRDVRLFEIGTRFAPDGETRGVAVAWTGGGARRALVGRRARGRLLRRQGRRRAAVRRARRAGALRAAARAVPRRRPGGVDSSRRRRGTGTVVGLAGQVAPAHRRRARAAAPGSRVRRRAEPRSCSGARAAAVSDATRPLPRHPFVVRDLSIVVVRRLACGDHSWHHSGGRPRSAGAARRDPASSIAIRARASRTAP